jgi:hypothetical protein
VENFDPSYLLFAREAALARGTRCYFGEQFRRMVNKPIRVDVDLAPTGWIDEQQRVRLRLIVHI